MTRRAARLRGDDGSILPLTVFFGFLALVLVLVVVAATSLYLERKRLFGLADSAAVVGAESFDLATVEATASGARPRLRSPDVASAVTGFVRGPAGARFESLEVLRAETTDGRSATVELAAYWRPPVVTLLVPEGFRIEVTAVARSVFE